MSRLPASPGEQPARRPTAIPPWAMAAAATARWPLWIGYAVSGIVYVVRIRETLRAAHGPGFVPAALGSSGWASEIFFLVGTAHWLTVGIHRNASPPRATASMILAGLHILLFAVRVWLAPVLSVMDAVGR